MVEEIERLWRNLSLTEEEQLSIEDDGDGSEEYRGCDKLWMVGRLLTTRPFNKQSMMHTLKLVWKLAKEFQILALKENLFLFKFASETDKNRVFDGLPWSFDKHLLMFTGYNGDLRPEEYQFKSALFWIRVYDLPLGKRNKHTTGKIGRQIGNLITIDPSLDIDGWPRFLRIRVEIDVTKPLRRAVMIRGRDGNGGVRGRLSYECLPTFCFYCGLLGHMEVDCEEKTDGV